MAQQATNPEAPGHEHSDADYVKVWGVLLLLLVVSVLGPMVGLPLLTLITAFGIALVKAYLVAKKFMHLNVEPRYVVYALVTCVALSFLFVMGTAPDVLRHRGQQWENLAAQAEVKRASASAETPSEKPVLAPMAPEVAFATICATCHGASGDGAGPAGAALHPKPANFQDPAFWETRDREHIAKVIRLGGAAVGRSPMMPAFGAQFDEAAARRLADHLSAQFRPKAPSP